MIIPYPRVGRRQSILNASISPITQGDFVNAIHFIWNKFNFNNGSNLSGFRHNLRNYYEDTVPMSAYELQYIRGLLSDPELLICVSPAGTSFRWENRATPSDRKCIFIDEAFYFLFCHMLPEHQLNALRLIFLGTILHCLGDYITAWAQPTTDFATTTNVFRFEGGTKTEYSFFGGIMGGTMNDGIHYECAKIRLFDLANQSIHWLIPDHLARDYYNSDMIVRFNEVNLQKNPVLLGPTNTIRQLDICCGWHRLVWKPIHRPPQDPQPASFPPTTYYGQPQATSQWYPPPAQPQQSGYFYTSAPGTSSYGQVPQFPPPSANFAGGSFAFATPSGHLGIGSYFIIDPRKSVIPEYRGICPTGPIGLDVPTCFASCSGPTIFKSGGPIPTSEHCRRNGRTVITCVGFFN